MPGRTPARLADLESALSRVARTVWSLRVATYAAGAPVDRAGFALLARLADLGDARPSDLAAALGVDLSTVSRQARHLEDAGLLDRGTDPDDGRACRLTVNEAGRELLDDMRAGRQQLLARALSDWSPEDRDRLTDLLTRLADDLGPDLALEQPA